MNRTLIKVLSVFTLMFGLAPVSADEQSRGAQVYSRHCAECHGQKGEGTPDNFPEGLFGDQPTIDLAEYISDAMPEGEPELCTGDDAKAVAEWMQTEFYSPEAQARLNPPRRKLSRLTVSQYRNSIADLVQSFSWHREPGEQRGLQGRYYKSRRFSKKDEVIERVDPIVDFDFKEGTPDKEKIPKAEQFSINWRGSIIITETGWYDFVIKTENGAKLYVNDDDTPLIDAWVKSGYDTEYRESIFLLAGRLYNVEFEWFTFKEKTASVGLWWKPPHGVDQPIPSRHLTPESSPYVLVVDTPFPPDDRSDGYIRGTSVSQEWDDATTMAAIETIEKLSPMVGNLAKIKKEDSNEQKTRKLQDFCANFAFRAFRRPLADVEKQTYVNNHFDSADSAATATRRSLLAILKSPRFLYREISGENDFYTKAERLSFALVDSIPSNDLLQAASKQWIKSEKGLRDQAWRMMNSFRGRTRLHEFLRVWMNLERLEEVNKDNELFPEFTPELIADLRASLELSLADAVNADDGFRTLLSSKQTWLNQRLANFYGVDGFNDGGFRPVEFEPDRRAGVTSHPFILSGLAYHKTSSPIHRGVFLSRGILGRALKPPPDSVAPLAPDLAPDLTTRERVIKQTSPAVCSNCHKMINSLGFALEEFDAVGRLRKKEKEKAIDASGHYRLRSGDLAEFSGASELAQFLVESRETHRSFSRQLFHHMVQQPILAYGPDSIAELADFFSNHDFNMNHLMVEIACRSANFSKQNPASGQAAE